MDAYLVGVPRCGSDGLRNCPLYGVVNHALASLAIARLRPSVYTSAPYEALDNVTVLLKPVQQLIQQSTLLLTISPQVRRSMWGCLGGSDESGGAFKAGWIFVSRIKTGFEQRERQFKSRMNALEAAVCRRMIGCERVCRIGAQLEQGRAGVGS
jgi:hypothetical protein